MTIYQQLAEKIESRVKNGQLIYGFKLPSIREMSNREGISPTSVVEAYNLLMSRGIIESRPRSGYFVCHRLSLPVQIEQKKMIYIPALEVNTDELIRAVRMAVHNPKIFPFGAASPLPDFYPTKAINRCISKVLREEPFITSEYRFPPGSEELRSLFSDMYRKLGVKESIEGIVTTGGAIESIALSLRTVARPGDVVGVETPIFFGIIQLIRSLGYNVMELPVNPLSGLLPERVNEAIRKISKLKAIVTISNFSNPLGCLMPDDNKEKLVSIASKNNIVIIEDDVYGDLFFNGSRPKPLKHFDNSDTVITCGSFSKTFNPAFRVGYAINKKYADEIAFHRTAISSGISGFAEEVLREYLDSGSHQKHLKYLRLSYKNLTTQYAQAILKSFPAETRVSEPQGGYVLWVQLPPTVDSRIIQRKALAEGISIAPGPVFSPSNTSYMNFFRVNCAIPWSLQSLKAVEMLGRLVSLEV